MNFFSFIHAIPRAHIRLSAFSPPGDVYRFAKDAPLEFPPYRNPLVFFFPVNFQ